MEGSRYSLDQEVRSEQVRLLFEGLRYSTLGALPIAVLLLFYLWNVVDHVMAVVWFSGFVLVLILRIALAILFFKDKIPVQQPGLWLSWFLAGSVASALVWGSGAWVLFPSGAIVHQAFMVILFTGLVAGAVTTLSASFVSISSFIFITLIPLAIRLLQSETEMIRMAGVLVLVFLAIVTFSTRRINDGITQNLRLRLESDAREHALQKSERHLKEAQRIAHFGNWDWDIQNNKIEWSDEASRIYGQTTETFNLDYQGFLNCLHQDDLEQVKQTINDAIELNKPYDIQHRIIHPDGNQLWVQARGEVFCDPQKHVRHMVGTVYDITERRHSEQKLQQAAKIIETIPDGVMVIDPEKVILFINPAFEKTTGYSAKEIIGKTPSILKSTHHEPDFYSDMWHQVKAKGYWKGEVWNRRKCGEIYPEWLSISAIRGNNGQITNYVGVFSDISTQNEMSHRLHLLAYYDGLTKLPNRMLFMDRLKMEVCRSQRSNKHFALLFIDLDRFKKINDTLGHKMGDQLLIEVAERLKRCVRGEDTVARLGGDEFTIILRNLDNSEYAAILAQKILDVLSKPMPVDGQELFLGGSIGVSIYPDDGENEESLLKNADTAMYRAKASGSNSFQFYEAHMSDRLHERLALENELRQAFEHGELQIYYQPQVDINNGQVAGLEALLRWKHKEKGWISPEVFIPIAEETGMILAIGEWVLRSACSQAVAWRRDIKRDLVLAVNVSARQLHVHGLENIVQSILQESGLPGDALELELTESTLMKEGELTKGIFKAFESMGVRLAIDDFGTGYSSLSYLKHFAINRLKIDKSFVQDVTINANDAAIAATIVAMAKTLNMSVTAEGVETKEQLEFFHEYKCDQYQGYLFNAAVPPEEVPGLLRA